MIYWSYLGKIEVIWVLIIITTTTKSVKELQRLWSWVSIQCWYIHAPRNWIIIETKEQEKERECRESDSEREREIEINGVPSFWGFQIQRKNCRVVVLMADSKGEEREKEREKGINEGVRVLQSTDQPRNDNLSSVWMIRNCGKNEWNKEKKRNYGFVHARNKSRRKLKFKNGLSILTRRHVASLMLWGDTRWLNFATRQVQVQIEATSSKDMIHDVGRSHKCGQHTSQSPIQKGQIF